MSKKKWIEKIILLLAPIFIISTIALLVIKLLLPINHQSANLYGNWGQSSQSKQEKKYDISKYDPEKEKTFLEINTGKAIHPCYGYKSLKNDNERIFYMLIKNNADKISEKKGYPKNNTSEDSNKDSEESNSRFENLYQFEPITVEDEDIKVDSISLIKALRAVLADNPDMFWLSENITYNLDDTYKYKIYLFSKLSNDEQKSSLKKLNEKVNKILSSVPKNTSEYEKEIFINNYMVNNCKYDHDSTKPGKTTEHPAHTSYACIVDNKAVCDGYSKAAQILFCGMGIECYTILGDAKESKYNNIHHLWNIIKINGNWYHLDITNNGDDKLTRYSYFNLNDNMIEKTHVISPLYQEEKSDSFNYNYFIPKCNSKEFNYIERNALKITSKEDLKNDKIPKKIASLKPSDDNIFYLSFSNGVTVESAGKYLCSKNSKVIFDHVQKANKNLAENGVKSIGCKSYKIEGQNALAIKIIYYK